MLRLTTLIAGLALSLNSYALSLSDLTQGDASGGLKDALAQGAKVAVLDLNMDNAERVAFIGYNPQRVRYAAFTIAGGFAGVGGALAAINFETTKSFTAAPSANDSLPSCCHSGSCCSSAIC